MKLISSLKSPYGRMTRMVCLEKKLEDRVEYQVIKTREINSSYYAINPSGRVPSLILDDGTVLEDSSLICWYLDNIDGNPTLHPDNGIKGLNQRRVEATARSMLDGITLWLREYIYKSPEVRSQAIINHERHRALRLADVFEKEVQSELLIGPINMPQIILACIFHGNMLESLTEFNWQDGRPKLCDWVRQLNQIASAKETIEFSTT